MGNQMVLCDLDGVVIQLMPEWLRIYEENGGEHLEPADIRDYDMRNSVKNYQLLQECLSKSGWDPLPEPGALDGLRALDKAGFHIRFVTYCATDEGFAFKKSWLREYMGDHWARKMIGVSSPYDKRFVDGDYLIEDSHENVLNWVAGHNNRRVPLVYAQPYNLNAPAYLERYTWPGIVGELTT